MPPPCEKSPLIVVPSSDSVPLNVGSPGTFGIANDTDFPSTAIDPSGNARRFCAATVIVPTHAGGVSCFRSISTSRGWAGTSSVPVQWPDAVGVCADTAGASAAISAHAVTEIDSSLMIMSANPPWRADPWRAATCGGRTRFPAG